MRAISAWEFEMLLQASEEKRACLWAVASVIRSIIGVNRPGEVKVYSECLLWELFDYRENERRREDLERRRMGAAEMQSWLIENYFREKARQEQLARERAAAERIHKEYMPWQRKKMGFYASSDDHAPSLQKVQWICPICEHDNVLFAMHCAKCDYKIDEADFDEEYVQVMDSAPHMFLRERTFDVHTQNASTFTPTHSPCARAHTQGVC